MRLPLALAVLLALTACEPTATDEVATVAASAPSPSALRREAHVTVALVVDQLALWHVQERFPVLPETGGFARLLREANAAEELRYGYVQTSTAMGHSSLFSGLSPHESLITSNEVLGPDGKPRAIVADPNVRLVGAAGALDRAGASLASFAQDKETLADALRRQRPDVTIACMSMKDRGAVFACGRAPDAVLWFDAKENAFVSSTAYGNELSALAGGFGARGVAAQYQAEPWQRLDAAWLSERGLRRGADVGQGDFEGLGKLFPHHFDRGKLPGRAMLATPMADELLTDLVLFTLDSLPPAKDAFVAVSFSAHDYVLHIFGPETEEAYDALLRLDRQLARVLDRLDHLYGPSGYSVVLSADHGGPPHPEGKLGQHCSAPGDKDRFERPCTDQLRIREVDLTARAQAAAEKAVQAGSWVLGTSEPFVVLTPEARALPQEKLDALITSIREELEQMPGVAQVVDARGSLERVCPGYHDDSLDALICRSLAGPERGDLLVLPKPGAFFDSGYVDGDGCNHGTPYLFDRAVPLIVRRPRAEPLPSRAVVRPTFDPEQRVDPRAYSRTLASFLKIDPPAAAKDGADLSAQVRL